MNEYPSVVAKIASDYLDRVKSQLRLVPALEQEEFLLELQSHIYEAYQQTPGEDDVARILVVLRNLGEPAEVVSDRLPARMVRAGTKRNLPLYVVSGILIALFGIPLGFGGMGVLIGLAAALLGVVVAFYAIAGSILLVGGLFMLLGLTRILFPPVFDMLISRGFLQLGPLAEFFDQLTVADQGLVMILIAGVFIAAGLGMVWLGKHLVRGLRFLSSLVFDWARRFAQNVRRRFHRERPAGDVAELSLVRPSSMS
jgi:uncharacterized membrane protein